MCGQSFSGLADRVIGGLAAKQHGVVARGQLLQAGLTPRQIEWRIHTGRLHEIHRGIYLVGHAVPPPLALEQAALLACGDASVLSHRSAANLWNLLRYPASAPVWVTVPPGRNATRSKITVRRARVPRRDIRTRHGLCVTSPPRTVLDLSLLLDERELESVVAEAEFKSLASYAELKGQLEGNEGKRGVAKLRYVLDVPGGPKRTRSHGERAMLRLLRRAGITGFETNARIHDYEVDFLWRDLRIVVELDGWDGHSGRIAFERDRLKIARLIAHGLTVVPVTGRQLRDDGSGVVARLTRTLHNARHATRLFVE
jgi:very-short-patch-repair endonuclease